MVSVCVHNVYLNAAVRCLFNKLVSDPTEGYGATDKTKAPVELLSVP